MLITSLENERVKKYVKLKEKKYRDKYDEFIVEGMHLVLEACKTGNVIELILQQDEVLPFNLPIVYVTNEIINKISSLSNPAPVMALCKKNNNEMLDAKKILVLDGIQDPGNLGTIIRSSKAFDVDLIVLSEECVDLYNEKVIRSTQGMIFHIPVIRRNIVEFLKEIKDSNIPIYGTKVEYGEDVRYLKEKDKASYVLVMGNEGSGLSLEVEKLCDSFLYIAMNDSVESLNVAVATSILLYEFRGSNYGND